MPLAFTKQAAQLAERRLRAACREVRRQWTQREQRQRRLEAFRLQGQLFGALGMRPALARVPR